MYVKNNFCPRLAGLGKILATTALGMLACGFGAPAIAAKPDKPPGKSENSSGSITLNTPADGPGIVVDRYASAYFDWQALGSPDCVRLNVPSRDGVDQGRVTMFHRGPFEECDASLRVDTAVYDFDSDGIAELTEENLRGQFRCWDIFADDHSGAYCRFLIMHDVLRTTWNIVWPEVTVSGSGDLLTVQNVGDAEVYKAVVVPKGNGGKTTTEMQFQDHDSIPLDFDVERH